MARQPVSASERVDGSAGARPSPGWPPPDEVMRLRTVEGFVSPLRPLVEGEPWCVFAAAGEWEWIFHPADAARHLAAGIVVDGESCYVEVVGDWPMIGGVQLRATHPDMAAAVFVEDRRAA